LSRESTELATSFSQGAKAQTQTPSAPGCKTTPSITQAEVSLTMPTPSAVYSYLVDLPANQGEYVNDAPHSFRQHSVADINDIDAINQQINTERGSVPLGCYVGWWAAGRQ
jgi:hypothetical protein